MLSCGPGNWPMFRKMNSWLVIAMEIGDPPPNLEYFVPQHHLDTRGHVLHLYMVVPALGRAGCAIAQGSSVPALQLGTASKGLCTACINSIISGCALGTRRSRLGIVRLTAQLAPAPRLAGWRFVNYRPLLLT